MALVSYTLGARAIEKHFILNEQIKVQITFSLEPTIKMARDISRTQMALGDGVKKTYQSEKEPLRKMATAIRANTDLAKGSILTSEMIKFAAPDDGLAPYNIES